MQLNGSHYMITRARYVEETRKQNNIDPTKIINETNSNQPPKNRSKIIEIERSNQNNSNKLK